MRLGLATMTHALKRVPGSISRIFLTASMFLFMVCAANAAGLSSVSGTITNGQALTISGSGFGTGPTANLLWDSLDTGPDGATISSSPANGSWVIENGPVYDDAQKHSGSFSSLGAGGDQFKHIRSGGSLSKSTGAKYYQSFWWRYNIASSANVKLVQLWGNYGDPHYGPGVYTGDFGGGWWASLIDRGPTDHQDISDWAEYPAQNVWYFFEMYLQQSAPSTANGTVLIHSGGALQYNKPNVITRSSAAGWEFTTFFDGITNASGGNAWVDDVYLSDSWAHVLVGNSVTYSSCVKKDIQPINWLNPAWSDTSINVRVNTGDYSNSTTIYLHIVDASGNVLDLNGGSAGQGYAIVVGQSYGGGPPVAAFSGAPLSGAAPLAVTFTDASTNSPTSWEWDFQNDATPDSTVQSPTYTYSTVGTFTVKLTATNGEGSDDETKVDYVTTSAAPPISTGITLKGNFQ